MLRYFTILLASMVLSFSSQAARADAKLFRVTLLGSGCAGSRSTPVQR
jgi:hypothetical protein